MVLTMFNDDTILTFGKYKRMRLIDVPNDYLIKFYNSHYKREDNVHKELVEYIKNKGILNPIQSKKTFVEDTIGHKLIGHMVRLLCNKTNKIIFPTENDAKNEIRRIRGLDQKNKKPQRAYECEKCSGWHLTSTAHKNWNK